MSNVVLGKKKVESRLLRILYTCNTIVLFFPNIINKLYHVFKSKCSPVDFKSQNKELLQWKKKKKVTNLLMV